MVWRFHMLCASMFVQRSRPQQHHCPSNPFPLPGHPSCIPSFRSQMYPFSCSGRALNISIRYEPNNTGCAIPFSIGITFIHSWRHNDIFPIAGLGTYISGVGIHLQLRGLIPFPSIGTHRRLANLESLVNNHTAGLFGVDISCSRWTEPWAGHLVHIAHMHRWPRSSIWDALDN